MSHAQKSAWLAWLLVALCTIGPPGQGLRARADTVTLKNGLVYHGTVDRDNTIVQVYDGLKRVVIRDSKISKTDADASLRNLERFQLVQPLEVHGGAMPAFAIGVQASQWDEFGRRTFQYLSPRTNKPVTMKQCINELGPYMVKIRGVDGFWTGQLSTTQVPRKVVVGLLAKVEQKNQNERMRVGRFLIQAEWYPEAKAELDRLEHDFPEIKDRVQTVRASVLQLEAEQLFGEIATRRQAQQPAEVLARLKSFPVEGAEQELLTKVRDQLRQDEAQAGADKGLAKELQALAERLPEETQKTWSPALVEILGSLAKAPDAVRGRLEAFQKADAGTAPDARYALALTGWVLGSDSAVADLGTADKLWKARELILDYLRLPTEDLGATQINALEGLEWTDNEHSTRHIDPDATTRIVRLLPPPLSDEKATPGQPKIYQVLGDGNPVPTDYGVLLPPEYHPLRSYPAIVALHSGKGENATERIKNALAWWAPEAQRRGYIVIAPEYNLPGQPADYRYTESEHGAVELALRDARRRFAIDSDRAFLGGQLLGGNMAWDYGLAHPDLFAGVAIVSGLPAKYVDRYKGHAERLPLYIAIGDLTGSTELVFALSKYFIAKNYETTYVEYFKRGLEDLPEEAPAIMDWMDHRKPREAYPKKFEVTSGRGCDNRFYGVVVREFASGRTMAPEAVEPLGKNLNPATIDFSSSALSNLIRVNANGVKRLDVWVSPKLIDFKKRLEVRVNNRPYFKGPAKPDLEPFLRDLRMRGDRQQVYWLKVSAG